MHQHFAHLHCHTDYSLLDGACQIPQMMKIAQEQEWKAIAITDHGNLFGTVSFYNAARKAGLKGIIGCEVYTVADDHTRRDPKVRYNHLVLLCKNEQGYRNLIKLVSTGYLEGFYYKPRINKDLLSKYSEGLICLSACLRGDLQEALLRSYGEGRKMAHEYQDIFGKENFYLEVQDHNLELDKELIPLQQRLAGETGIPLVASNDAHYLTRGDAAAHEALLCVQTGKTLSDPKRMRFGTQEFYLKSVDEMASLFNGNMQPLYQTGEIADMCNLDLQAVRDPFPKFDVPDGRSLPDYFGFIAKQGFEQRKVLLEQMAARGELRQPLEAYEERLEYEIDVIRKMNYSGYFLIVWDFIRYARERNIPVGPGRGSAAGSLVAYAMSITDIDPMQYGLLFERFLNIERKSMPDVDIDFCMNRRGDVIRYVTEKYGREQVAQIITFNTMATKAAIKDVGRVMDMSYGQVDGLTKLVPKVLHISLDDAIKQEPKLQQAMERDGQVGKLIETARRLEGVARNPSVHAAGVVIAPQPLQELVPLYKTSKNEIVTQYDMKSLDQMGLLKMDFLGLTTLTIIDDAFNWIEKSTGTKPKQGEIPLDDAKTYQLFADGLTSGVFQFESKGMRDICMRYKPERLEDLCALNALYRPGPIQGGMIPDFIGRKHGRKKVTYLLREVEPILKETYGVIVYQEQVMQIANVVAGYSLGEADLLRRAMGKKKPEEMALHRERFLSGSRERGLPAAACSKLFDLMEQFAGYGFNKSHSAAYGYLAYITAYLKANHTVAFLSALLTAEQRNTDKLRLYLRECRDMGIEILPPDVGASDWDFAPLGEKAIVFGLGALRHVGRGAVESVVAAREEGGEFRSLSDLCNRVDLNKVNRRMLESSVKAGALDRLPGHRAQLLAGLESAVEAGLRVQRDRETGQASLFGGFDADPEMDAGPTLPDVPEWDPLEKLAHEKEMLGLYVSGHPLDSYRDKIEDLEAVTCAALAQRESGEEVRLCGVLHGVQQRKSREGQPWALATLEDMTGSVELLVFTSQLEALSSRLVADRPVLVDGSVRAEDETVRKVAVNDIIPLESARPSLPEQISITVRLPRGENEASALSQRLQDLIRRHPGETDVMLRIRRARDFEVTYDIPQKVRAGVRFRASAEEICGPEAIEFQG